MSTTTPKEQAKKQSPVKVIRVGAVAASIWRRQTSTGLEYLDFSLSRSWKLKSGEREGYSQNFFDHNEEALFEVINLACRFIRDERGDSEASDFNRNVVAGSGRALAAA
ncbi:MAG: hypothetical protein KDA37_16675 [Planctomycetales bacterium]|nr:hypothetical protein [Planctomycetales bacterium]